jgi:hypothetical protein
VSLYRAVGFALARKRRAMRRNKAAREAVETLPPYIDSRSDNISLLGANLAALRPYLKA